MQEMLISRVQRMVAFILFSFGWSAYRDTGGWKSWHEHLIRIKLLSVDHSFLDRRSLAFHMAIAEKLRSDPRLLGKVCDRLRALMQDSSVSISVRDAYREWLLFMERHSFDEYLR